MNIYLRKGEEIEETGRKIICINKMIMKNMQNKI